MSIWEEVLQKYPSIQDVLDDVYKSQLELFEKMESLDELYPVDGYEWDYNPNDIGSDINPWGLYSISKREESIKRCDEALAKQKLCVEGKHHFKHIGPYEWCSYCGTIKSGNVLFYPENPHFLPTNKNSV